MCPYYHIRDTVSIHISNSTKRETTSVIHCSTQNAKAYQGTKRNRGEIDIAKHSSSINRLSAIDYIGDTRIDLNGRRIPQTRTNNHIIDTIVVNISDTGNSGTSVGITDSPDAKSYIWCHS